ncbi:imm11 family protein [Vibrio harveyi]
MCLNKQSWRAVNILTQLDAIDHSATKFNLRDGKQSRVRPFKKLVLKKKAVNGAGLFRVQGAGLRMFCTDKKGGLYERVHELGLTGLSFKEIQLSP